MDDTIAAISTSLGVGAISIVRVSGEKAIEIVNSVFKGKNLFNVPTHSLNYGHILYEKNIIDEVLVAVMKRPRTFTMEDIVEINCHGGIATTNKILEIILSQGARLAEPGEFTKRAFLNGRIDLIEAEGIMDLINSKTDKARQLAINQVDGNVSFMIKELRKELVSILTNIEVNIDYPEYEDILIITEKMIEEKMQKIQLSLEKILKESEDGRIIKEGIKTLIIGRPNVGKSSILNLLLKEEKAIVTDIPGTTRDIVEGSVIINGIPLNIIDTAGIRKTENIVEKIGVEKSLNLINQADLIILVLNNNEILNNEDIELLAKTKNKKRIIFINKIDLDSKIDFKRIDDDVIIKGSTFAKNGLNSLKEKIMEIFNLDEIEQADLNYLSNVRQISLIKEALNISYSIKDAIINNVPVDIIEMDIKRIWELLGNIIGDYYSEELIDQLFCQFCVGK